MQPLRIELNPILAALLGLSGLALLGWSGATTSYALFRDEFLMQLVSRHTTTERASRSEIARLRDDYERVNSQLLVERETFASELGTLAERQAEVEKRQSVLSRFGAPTEGEDLDGGLRLRTEPLQESRATPARGSVAELNARYDAIETDQRHKIAVMQTRLEQKRTALTDVYASLGLQPQAPVKAGMGGLYLPFGLGGSSQGDADQLTETARETDLLRQGLSRVPVGKPLPELRTVSGFGNRTDPFVGGLAFHSGVDLEAAPGAPARATASGTVTSAEWNGGYGLMVEVKHDHGYSTRYAHLSRIAVKTGDEIEAGDVVGFVGSTGRSTGPHLHYETRRDDTALNPVRFLKAASAIAD
ncbi:membrane protein [Terrihabitans soli]|uniref:Membrane protein n=1 Tax=Terrihabitans soli TaxID=708113 RepID=A0A6S6QVI1_9HYPH|nr:M23 family metallopeptidase [Terrihabitans soli]BCJ91091.1 membrane protein [Terrihabitans soli]